jgi:hypothetical protein
VQGPSADIQGIRMPLLGQVLQYQNKDHFSYAWFHEFYAIFPVVSLGDLPYNRCFLEKLDKTQRSKPDTCKSISSNQILQKDTQLY